MANTVMTAKNSFEQGLLMDFAPENTSANCLTSALNATLITYNGNEMSLQNDMGNGRVETAFLPEGYIPVGSCEFGDIIYIVSYNPISNKSQIGCFPSPERNISSEEIGLLQQSLTWEDFQESYNGNPTGKLKSTSIKKIIFEKGLNPGDKFIVYSDENIESNKIKVSDYGNTDHEYGNWPKMVKLHVVSIEDSGKINYLDSTVKWYNNDYFIQQNHSITDKPDIDSYRNLVSSAYTVFQSKVNGKLAILAELEKITGFSCTHSVYTTESTDGRKTFHVYLNSNWTSNHVDINPSGFVLTQSDWRSTTYKTKNGYSSFSLPLSVNTSSIRTSFSSSYYLDNPGDSYANYKNNLCYKAQVRNFESNEYFQGDLNNLPRKITQKYTPEGLPDIGNYYINAYFKEDGILKYYTSTGVAKDAKLMNLTDTFVHNYFNKDIVKHFYDLTLTNFIQDLEYPYTKTYSDLTNIIHTYTVCPAMPYGYLEEYSVTNSIDFSKVGSGFINFNEWRYYNDGEIGTITFGIEAYPEENKGISKIELDFYDNQGLAARMTIKDRISYSGSFTEVFQFNSSSNKNITGEGFVHKGDGPYELQNGNSEDIANLTEMINNGIYIQDGDYYYINDSGILYPNILYMVKIKVFYQTKNALGEFDLDTEPSQIYKRWYWTNNMYNKYYHTTKDFKDLKIDLNLKLQVAFQENDNMVFNDKDSVVRNTIPNNYSGDLSTQYLSLGYKKYSVDTSGGSNLNMAILPSLEQSYDTFVLTNKVFEPGVLTYHIWEGDTFINKPENITQISSENSEFIKNQELILPIISKNDQGNIVQNIEKEVPEYSADESEFKEWTDSLKDWFTLSLDSSLSSDSQKIEYLNINNEIKNINSRYYKIDASLANPENDYTIPLTLKGSQFSKLMSNRQEEIEVACDVYVPFIRDVQELDKYNMMINKVSTCNGQYTTISFKKIYNIAIGDKYGNAKCYYGETNQDGLLTVGSKDENFGSVLYGELNPGKGDKTKISISDVMKANSVDIGPFSILSTVDDTGRDREDFCGVVEKWNLLSGKDFEKKEVNINSKWLEEWGRYSPHDGGKAKEYCIQGGLKTYNYISSNSAGATFTFQLVGRDTLGNYIPFNAFARSLTNQNKQATQVFGKQTTSTYGTKNVGNFYSFAHIIASMLAQLYYKDATSTSRKINALNDTIINSFYKEKWVKEFIIKCNLINPNSAISLLGIPFDEYLQGFEDLPSNNSNITINLDTINKQSNLVQFEHTVNYDIQELVSKYVQNQNKLIYMEQDITKTKGGLFLEEIPKSREGILIIDFENNKLIDPMLKNTRRLLVDNTIRWDDNEQDIISIDNILNQPKIKLTVKDGMAALKPTSITTNVYKGSASAGQAGGGFWDESLAAGFDSTVVFNEMFKI